MAWFENLNKITFFGVYSKMADTRPFLIFFYLFLNFCTANKNCDYSANFHLKGPQFELWTFFIFWAGRKNLFFRLFPLSVTFLTTCKRHIKGGGHFRAGQCFQALVFQNFVSIFKRIFAYEHKFLEFSCGTQIKQ